MDDPMGGHPRAPRRILTVIGTRPEAIKMAPVIKALAARGDIESALCITGQHQTMLDQVLDLFELRPTFDLAIMKSGQTLVDITTGALTGVARVIAEWKPDVVLVHGDTTTAMASAMAAFYARVTIGHVEAGLRTNDLDRPWPEEMNRRTIDGMAHYLFAPTEGSRANLLGENLGTRTILVTGNTVVDALKITEARLNADAVKRGTLDRQFAFLDSTKRLILVTGHRRESFGGGFEAICRALARLARRGDVEILYPVHLNPNVQEPVRRILGNEPRVHLMEPCDYLTFVYLMMRSHLILTDSGGVQEEAPSLAKPVLVMRDVTERPEALATGIVRLVGADEAKIVAGTEALLDQAALYSSVARAGNPFGDGHAAERIVDALAGVTGRAIEGATR
jgi:UDP-N-acetylglucosamine 2-epimerase (non-hydrolysing)